MIFTPQWVGERLFNQKEVSTRVPLTPELPVFYLREDIELGVAFDRLFLKPSQLRRDCMEPVEQMACRILAELPHTPVSGVGVNYAFDQADPPDSLNRLFTFDDRVEIDSMGWEARVTNIKRTLSKEGQGLNLSFIRRADTTSVEANFHSDVSDTTAARAAIEGRVVGHYDTLCEILWNTHRLVVEEAPAND
jgi:hypothetical protein